MPFAGSNWSKRKCEVERIQQIYNQESNLERFETRRQRCGTCSTTLSILDSGKK
jgi:hypothetical protein